MPTQSLKSKIFAGFAIIVLLLIANGIVSYLGLEHVRSDNSRLSQVEATRNTIQRIDRDVQELKLRVARYVSTGYDSQREEAHLLYQRLIDNLDAAKERELEPTTLQLLDQIGGHLQEYSKQFELVTQERSLREKLVNVELSSQAEDVAKGFSQLASFSDLNELSDSALLEMLQVQALFTEAEQSLLRYFETPDSLHASSFVRSINATISGVESTEGPKEALNSLVESVQQFERLGIRAIQATRSYMFLLNVVMSGEASEISYYSRVLSDRAEQSRDEISARVAATSSRVKRTTGFTVLAAIILSSLIAGRLGMLIVPPITALTKAFGQLSSGETLHEIPGTERHDEIGQMAQAAKVFNSQNLKTRELLAESEQLSNELQEQALELELMNQDLDSFAYVASHDLKSPLRGIRQLATWIEEDAGQHLPAESAKHLELLKSRITKMETLLEDLLEFSRVGRIEPTAEEVDLSEMMQSLVDLTDNPNRVEVQWANDMPTFNTLRAPLEQVLLNLIGNAIKHNHRDSHGRVDIECHEIGDRYRFMVKDNGPGIHKNDHERVFQMYQRVGDTSIEGSGMGLAIVKKQIEHLGGEVTLDSQLGEGTTFEFTWPATIENTQA